MMGEAAALNHFAFARRMAIPLAALLLSSAPAVHAQIFVTDSTSSPSPSVGEYNADGSPVNTALVPGLQYPWGIAVSGTDIFVADDNANAIGKFTTVDGSGNATFIPVTHPIGVAVSGTDLYVALPSSNSIGKYSTVDGTGTDSFITGLNMPYAVAVSGTDLFVANYMGGTVDKYDTSGAAASGFSISGLVTPDSLTVIGSNVFVLSAATGTIGEYDSATGAAVDASFIARPGATAIAAMGSDILVAYETGTSSGVAQYSSAGALLNDGLITGLSGPSGIAVSAVPEAQTEAGIAIGLAMLGWEGRRRRRLGAVRP